MHRIRSVDFVLEKNFPTIIDAKIKERIFISTYVITVVCAAGR